MNRTTKLTTSAAAIFLLTVTHASPYDVRVYGGLGQGGYITSDGMPPLMKRIAALDKVRIKATLHGWRWGNFPNDIAADIRRQPANVKIVLVGYSITAGGATIVSVRVPERPIALAVAYDPSWLTTFPAAPPNLQRVLLYHNGCAPIWGRAYILGPQVETTEVCSLHLRVDNNQALHTKTLNAIKKVLRQ